jgi:hypothetical protein
MTKHTDDRTLEVTATAWRAFVDSDVRVCAPAELEERVWDAIRSRAQARRPLADKRRTLAVVSLAAGVALAVVPTLRSPTGSSPEALIAHPVPLANHVEYRPVLAAHRVTRDTPRPQRPETAAGTRVSVLMTLGADPLQETEVVRVVRLRLPREALQALGLAVLEPEAQGSIDVDVVVGEDGLAREIRQMRAGQE